MHAWFLVYEIAHHSKLFRRPYCIKNNKSFTAKQKICTVEHDDDHSEDGGMKSFFATKYEGTESVKCIEKENGDDNVALHKKNHTFIFSIEMDNNCNHHRFLNPECFTKKIKFIHDNNVEEDMNHIDSKIRIYKRNNDHREKRILMEF